MIRSTLRFALVLLTGVSLLLVTSPSAAQGPVSSPAVLEMPVLSSAVLEMEVALESGSRASFALVTPELTRPAPRPRSHRARFLIGVGASLLVSTTVTTSALWLGVGCYEDRRPIEEAPLPIGTSIGLATLGAGLLIAGLIRRFRRRETETRGPMGRNVLYGILMGLGTAGMVGGYSLPGIAGCTSS